ncbi:hypothetical protein ABQW72_00145 [Xanthomonas hortorum pv. pelargonii]|uniref:hypothetical protein n=1 Tax=Xanthomonas hortorum TaxID=56454 RepID=UPI0021C80140|nr:hypothetical protein [Xanthomonas hortorum]MCU1709565.1 hypothetical protein [Xanthomonas hortorum pv. pelargonii]WCI07259.1 hypothetical protein PML25_22860 [Xanthomonas hortorum pv. pelargonii]WOB33006.1 hypothetical protein NYR98_22780 [Xanthomonas hortorum pv. pelargonii]
MKTATHRARLQSISVALVAVVNHLARTASILCCTAVFIFWFFAEVEAYREDWTFLHYMAVVFSSQPVIAFLVCIAIERSTFALFRYFNRDDGR